MTIIQGYREACTVAKAALEVGPQPYTPTIRPWARHEPT